MRKLVLKFFSNNKNSFFKARNISRQLKITSDADYVLLKQLLHKLYEENLLEKNGKKYMMPSKTISTPSNLVRGVFDLTEDSYGFVIRKDAEKEDIFIPARHFGCAFHGDTVEVSLFAKKKKGSRKSLEGEIVNVSRRKYKELSGVLHKSNSFYFIIPDLDVIHRNIYIHPSNLNGAVEGNKVVVNEIFWTNPHLNPEGKVARVLNYESNLESEVMSIAAEFNLKHEFHSKALEEAESIPEVIPDEEIAVRLDYRDKNVFTIDPSDAKDFDDALSVEFLENGNLSVGIHIADVSHYVINSSRLDKEAAERGNSVYLVGKVIPMLPEKLSNRICSLVPNEDRLTYSVIAELTPRGRVVEYKIAKTIINSKRRFTYEEAQKVIETGSGDLQSDILALEKLAKVLKKKRLREGSIDFTSNEVKFELNDSGLPIAVTPKKTLDSNNLIEEYMLLANKIVASHVGLGKINRRVYPFVYRIHDKPDKERLADFGNFVKSLNYPISLPPNATALDLNKLTEFIKGKPEESLVNDLAIRSMAKAVYSEKNIGHFGLGFSHYSHFTSPIRRYADLLVHRFLYQYLETPTVTKPSESYLTEICRHISETERSAIEAERFSVKLKHIQFLRDQVGNEFEGVISGVTNFGLYVRLNDSYAEGLVHVKDMGKDFYVYDERKYSLIGRKTKKVYRTGDKVTVKLVRITEERMQIDFILPDLQ